jgi:hypothetical protein
VQAEAAPAVGRRPDGLAALAKLAYVGNDAKGHVEVLTEHPYGAQPAQALLSRVFTKHGVAGACRRLRQTAVTTPDHS